MSNPIISICIPAYKNTEYLQRLMDTIAVQTYKNFEVVITDDSNDDSILELIKSKAYDFPLSYFKNSRALGSPENWNAAIKKCKGEWVKIMHDDDWFASQNSLQSFADAVADNKKYSFIFPGYNEIDVARNKKKKYIISRFYQWLLKKSPLYLFKRNFIGHPSTTLIKKVMIFFMIPI